MRSWKVIEGQDLNIKPHDNPDFAEFPIQYMMYVIVVLLVLKQKCFSFSNNCKTRVK